jgi:hypothetical protein
MADVCRNTRSDPGSGHVNDSIERRLDSIVDRVVGPVRASRSWKRFIHEELCSHVQSVFHEEMARLGNEQAAFQATRERFGVEDELEFELQACVPRLERWLLLSERDIIMSRWFWWAALFAVFFGPAIVLPALAKFRDHGELLFFPLTLGILITLAGLGGVLYGVVKRFANSTS